MRNPRFSLQLFLAMLIAAVLLQGCFKDAFKTDNLEAGEWSPSLAIPLAKSKLTLGDVLKEHTSEMIEVQSDGLVVIIYNGKLESYDVGRLISIPNQVYDESYSFPSSPAQQNVSVNHQAVVPFSTQGSEVIDSVLFESGTLTLSMAGDGYQTNTLRVNIPWLTYADGTSYSEVFNKGESKSLDLAGLTLHLTRTNQLDIEFVGNIDTDGSPGQGSIDVHAELINLKYEIIYGMFGTQNVALDSDSIRLDLFRNSSQEGVFELSNPSLHITTQNSLGLPIRVEFTELQSKNINTGDAFNILNSPSDGVYNIASAPAPFDSVQSSLIFDRSNSEIITVISPTPQFLSSIISATGNPQGGTTPNFLTNKSKLNIHSELRMPLEGKAKNITMGQDVTYQMDESFEEIQSISLRINSVNGFPFDVYFEINVLDRSGQVMGTIVPAGTLLLASAIVDGDGLVNEEAKNQVDVPLSKEQIQLLENGDYLRLRAVGSTLNQGSEVIKVYEDYSLELQLGLLVNAKLDI